MSTLPLPPLSARRRNRDRCMRALALGLTLVVLVPLALVIYELISKGIAGIGNGFFSTDPTGSFFGSVGGVRSAILGSLEITLIATLISAPLGIGAGRYLTRHARSSSFARTVARGTDGLAGVPPIVLGLVIYATLVLTGAGGAFAGWKGAVAVALLMLAPIAHSATDSTGRHELLAGVLLAAARGIGEAAPLLFTASSPGGVTLNPANPMNSLPVQIFDDISSPRPAVVQQAWAAGLTLVVIVLVLTLLARAAARQAQV